MAEVKPSSQEAPASTETEGGIKRPLEDEEKGKTEEGHHAKAQKTSETDTPGAVKEKGVEEHEEKLEEKTAKSEKGEEGVKEKDAMEMEVPPLSEPRATGDTHEEVHPLERGHIFFFYRPKVDIEHANDFSEVQKSYVILHPDGPDATCRLLIIPKKVFPNVQKRSDRVYAFIDVAGSIDDLVSTLKDTEYETKSGKRKQSGARLVARGVYLLANHKEPKSAHTFTNHVHLAYVLTHPSEPHPLQKVFHIYDEGDFVVQVKNPKDKSSHIPQSHKEMPSEEILKLFADHKFIPLNPPHLIDYKGAELLLIAAHHYGHELGDEEEKLEKTAEREKHKISMKQIKAELHLAKNDPKMSLNPLSGKWD